MSSEVSLRKKLLLLGISVLGATLLLTGAVSLNVSGSSSRTGFIDVAPALAANLQDNTIYMPYSMNRYPVENIFGVGLNTISTSGGLDALAQTHSSWVRKDGVRWNVVEPVKGERNWEVLANLDVELLAAARAHQRVVLIVQGTPAWAARELNTTCGPIKREELATFGNFMYELVRRYSGPPYNIKNWEIWNEPDTDALNSVEGFGCWGDANDEYFGGGYYAEMLSHVYPAVKSADPHSRVIVGGLLLDCDPDICLTIGNNENPPKFLEGILVAGGGNFFDGISFHAYDYYHNGGYWNPNWNTSLSSTGPVSIAKAAYIRDLLSRYGVNGKFLMNTESALLCDENCGTDFETTKANYVVHAYALAASQNFEANLWYNMLGWRGSGLLDSNLVPRDAYRSFKFAAEKIGGATFSAKIVDNNLDGYEFRKGNRRILVLWSKNSGTYLFTPNLPPVNIYDAYGNQKVNTEIGPNPVYIELIP
jgi:hypothetical protein